MHTKAVFRAAEALNQVGLRVLRFNFRGVGISTGTFEDGVGEEDDVRAALDWINPGLEGLPMILGGHSFGSMVGLSVGVMDERVRGMVALGLPIQVYDYTFLARTEKPVLVVQGEHDRFGASSEVREMLAPLGSHLTLREIRGAGHLFEGYFEELRDVVEEFFSAGPGARILARGSDVTE
jgi:alpha/beta superfamily hydrolase